MTDAFDALGAQTGSGVGRESMIFRCSCLPEFVDRALRLHAEMLRTPTFPDEFCNVGIELLQQELTALEDDPGELARRLIGPHAYGPILGRHELGTRESLASMARDDIVGQWKTTFSARRMQITVGGQIDPDHVAARVDQLFTGFGDEMTNGEDGFEDRFVAGTRHHPKQLEQEHLLICWPGVRVAHDEYPTERLTIAMLGEGMSSRLFAEVREKQGLVYWVGAWDEHPRTTGRLFMGASTTPARCDQTYRTLLQEVSRLAEDVTDDELERARIGIIARNKTHGDITRARVGELATDLFHYGRPMPTEEKHARLRAVTVADVRRYLEAHPRDELCVLTLGPRSLETGDDG
jgi:predicted Zn-dependent peptidase